MPHPHIWYPVHISVRAVPFYFDSSGHHEGTAAVSIYLSILRDLENAHILLVWVRRRQRLTIIIQTYIHTGTSPVPPFLIFAPPVT